MSKALKFGWDTTTAKISIVDDISTCYIEGNDLTTLKEKSSTDQRTVHPILTLVVLFGVVSVGIIIFERSGRRALRGGYISIDSSVSAIEITGNPMFAVEVEEQNSIL